MNKEMYYLYVLNNLINIIVNKNKNEFMDSIFSFFMKKKLIYNLEESIIEELKKIFQSYENKLTDKDLILLVKKITSIEPMFKFYLKKYDDYVKDNSEQTDFYKQIERLLERKEDVK